MLKNYIDGKWVDSASKTGTPVLNPATEELLGTCPTGAKEDLNTAAMAAHQAFQTWRKVPPVDRIQYFFKLKQALDQNFEDIARMCTMENGKTLVEARGSVKRGLQMVEQACAIPTMLMGEALEDIAPGIDCKAIKRPMGVFSMIAPSNFPAMVPFWFWPFGVACGNTFIVKPSERVPMSQMKIFELIDKVGFPKGVVNLVHGGKETVDAILDHPKIHGVSFVGSTPVASYIYKRGCENHKRVQALGGAKNTMVILPDAAMDKTVKTALESITGCAGQRCLAGSVLACVGAETKKEVEDRIVPLAREITVGNGLDPAHHIGPVISSQSRDRICNMIENAVKAGAKLLEDGRMKHRNQKGFYLGPTILTDVRPDMEIAKEEVFGPVVCIMGLNTFDDAIKFINDSPYGNTTTLFTTSGANARKFSYEIDPAMIGINIGVPAPMSFFSFGGTKDSFYGDVKAHGNACVGFFTDTKVTIERWGGDENIWYQKKTH